MVRSRRAAPPPEDVLAGSVTGLLLVLLALVLVWGRRALPVPPLEGLAEVLSALLLIAVIGLLLLLGAARRP